MNTQKMLGLAHAIAAESNPPAVAQERPTPITDAAEETIIWNASQTRRIVSRSVAQKLERELAEANEKLAEARSCHRHKVLLLQKKIHEQAEEIERLRGAIQVYQSTLENSRRAVSKGSAPYDLLFFDAIVGPAIDKALSASSGARECAESEGESDRLPKRI